MKRARALAATVAAAAIALSACSGPGETAGPGDDQLATLAELERLDELHSELGRALLDGDDARVAELDAALTAAGVETISAEAVRERFPEAYEFFGGQAHDTVAAAVPAVVAPSHASINFRTMPRTKITYNGKKYEVQILNADPTTKASKLRGTGNASVRAKGSLKASATNVLVATAKGAVGWTPKGAVALTIYEATKGAISGMKTTTVVTDIEASYTWGYTMSARFVYLKQEGKADSFQNIVQMSTKTEATIDYRFPIFVATGLSARSNVTGGKKYRTDVPSCWNGMGNWAKTYLDGKELRCFAGDIDIAGPAGKKVHTIKVLQPRTPSALF